MAKKKQSQVTKEQQSILLNQYINECWNNGDLFYKLKDHQVPLYKAIMESKSKRFVVNCSRRFGKSFILCLIACEHALQKKNAHIRFAAPTQKQLREIVQPIFTKIFQDCPEKLRPEFKTMMGHYYFPSTDSYIHVTGCDNNNAENLRGHESDLNLIDEAGFVEDLEYVMKDILMPQTLTTGGRTIVSSTPSRTPAHYFTRLCHEAKALNFYSIYTINDNTEISYETKLDYCQEAGGEDSTTWRREYLCEFVVDEESVIIPEWKSHLYIGEIELDGYRAMYQNYVGMDIGGKHKTAILFGYYSFKKATLQIEDEAIFSGSQTTSELIAKTIVAIENELWNKYDFETPMRISDNNNVIFLQDLSILHKIHFSPTGKDTLTAMINEMRVFIGQGRLKVHPKCKELIGCLESGVWNNQRNAFDVSDIYGHYDALAALMYMIRNIDQYTNPVIQNLGKDKYNYYIRNENKDVETFNSIKKLFKRSRGGW